MLPTDNTGLYTAYKVKDVRFDGRFFVGIASTGIYCRPVCKARLPKEENCTFYRSAAEAEQAGFRPCLLCRPEIAPGSSIADATLTLAHKASRMLEENCGSGQSLKEIAAQLGCRDRHLRRAFAAEYNVSPVQYLQTCRLLLAKNLLTETDLTVLDIAMGAGFGSLRRFNDNFKKHYRLSPTSLRKNMREGRERNGNITISLGYRPPYLWKKLLDFFAFRAIPGVELVRDNQYIRTVHLLDASQKHIYGWISVKNNPQNSTLSVTVSETLLPVLPQVRERVRQLFDLYCNADAVYETLAPMNEIRPGLCSAGTRLPGSFDSFEMSVRAVLGQQITVKAAATLAGRLVAAYGTAVQTGVNGLTHVFPTPEDILNLAGPIENHLGPLGITARRAKTIYALADAFAHKKINLALYAQPEVEIKKLMGISGIGSWTAQYIAMRAMGWPDAFLETDAGIKKALAPHTPKELLHMAEIWRPWRSYATINIWNSL